MKIYAGQIYIGATFPFSIPFQGWLGKALSERVEISEQFRKQFGADYDLGIRISAKQEIAQPELRGPTVFRRDKDVEFTIFLPHEAKDYHDPILAAGVLDQLLHSVVLVLQQLGLDAQTVLRDIPQLRSEFLSTPGLLKSQTDQ